MHTWECVSDDDCSMSNQFAGFECRKRPLAHASEGAVFSWEALGGVTGRLWLFLRNPKGEDQASECECGDDDEVLMNA